MRMKSWTCVVESCPVKHLVIGHLESVTLDNLLAAVRCPYCLVPMTPGPIPLSPPAQPVKN